ncbi:HAD-IIIA family hydrolase [Arthrobacter sp. B3I4]|uniref:D-glycero-alpha-D-manno-heptose-1,7-bisphosphate 7-phosphatase n=1 Tax=Arthrobacter sp. B3I4 TaxID=3042267 RepID=UPI0027897745|nr:HAD-IIIA family hydrolase [Arthrobacter sp. B3I4]MDQ0755235.1 D-glycero-D-manno-heptose 1,7-bisphosphate phosphatase [Arthrobacter sp. B3I4]
MEPSAGRVLGAVLFDRDGTLIHDVPYNGDPARVRPMPSAREALRCLRVRGLATGVLSNQSGIGRGILTLEQVAAVNVRVEQLLGPFDVWGICPHRAEDRCACRKPAPGLIRRACRQLRLAPAEVAYVGDIGSDVEAAQAAGARGILVPTSETLQTEVEAAPEVAPDLWSAVQLLLAAPSERPTHLPPAAPQAVSAPVWKAAVRGQVR